MSSSISAECEAGADPGRPRVEAPNQVRQERATPRCRCASAAPRVRHHRATSLAEAAEGRRSPANAFEAAQCMVPDGLLGPASAPCAVTRGPQRSPAKGAEHQAVAGSAGMVQRVVARRAPGRGGAGTQRLPLRHSDLVAAKPRQGRLPGPIEKPGSPATPISNLHVRPSRAPGCTWHTPRRTRKIQPQHIGTQLSRYAGPGITRLTPGGTLGRSRGRTGSLNSSVPHPAVGRSA